MITSSLGLKINDSRENLGKCKGRGEGRECDMVQIFVSFLSFVFRRFACQFFFLLACLSVRLFSACLQFCSGKVATLFGARDPPPPEKRKKLMHGQHYAYLVVPAGGLVDRTSSRWSLWRSWFVSLLQLPELIQFDLSEKSPLSISKQKENRKWNIKRSMQIIQLTALSFKDPLIFLPYAAKVFKSHYETNLHYLQEYVRIGL